jgi:hypothetical protein
MEAQKLNFPELKFVEKLPWPDDDLSETVVIAHPPCAPFSIMNPMKGQEKYQGATADGFTCHRQVMDYALRQGCQALTIESVPGVMKAAEEYTNAAKKHGYSVYFLRLNSISFGVPQWRARVWIIFTRSGQPFGVNLSPDYHKLSEIVQTEGTILDRLNEDRAWIGRGFSTAGLAKRLTGSMGGPTGHNGIPKGWLSSGAVDPDLLRKIFEGEYGTGGLLRIGQEVLGLDDPGPNFIEVRKAWNLGGLFAAMMPRILDPEGWAPTVLGGSAWFIHGRPLLLEEYNLIMGFPKDYQWPDSYSDPRVYLSKGVCPPVATWILKQIQANLEDQCGVGAICQPGELLDLCPKKVEVERALRGEVLPTSEKRVKQQRGPKAAKAPIPRVKVQASDLAAQFLASLRRDDAQ